MKPEPFVRASWGYESYSEPFRMSPVYVVASAARRLIKAGREVALSDGWDVNALDRVTWFTGRYYERANVSFRQAEELAEVARVLRDHHGSETTEPEREAIASLLAVVSHVDGGSGE